jgi:hypothetical protein
MEENSQIIDQINFVALPDKKKRIRKVDWMKVLEELDQNPGEWALIGIFDRSIRSHIAHGRYSYIDPALYEVTTTKLDSGYPKNMGNLFMRRRVANTQNN